MIGSVELSILGSLAQRSCEGVKTARRLLIFASLVTLALKVADSGCGGARGRAAFDSIGPFLLIGWAEVGLGLLQAINIVGSSNNENDVDLVSRDSVCFTSG